VLTAVQRRIRVSRWRALLLMPRVLSPSGSGTESRNAAPPEVDGSWMADESANVSVLGKRRPAIRLRLRKRRVSTVVQQRIGDGEHGKRQRRWRGGSCRWWPPTPTTPRLEALVAVLACRARRSTTASRPSSIGRAALLPLRSRTLAPPAAARRRARCRAPAAAASQALRGGRRAKHWPGGGRYSKHRPPLEALPSVR
jgi:hypothetical protein